MAWNAVLQVSVYLAILILCIKPLGAYVALVYQGEKTWLHRLISPLERGFYYLARINPEREMNWKEYLAAFLVFNMCGILLLYGWQRLQFYLPFNPQHLGNISPQSAFNTAISFVTNTDWQSYEGETTMSYLTQCGALTVQNFLSAATGLSILVALTRGLRRAETLLLGNFWVDTLRGVLYILLPLSFILAIILVAGGVIQNVKSYAVTQSLEAPSRMQLIPMGPVASQVAIKQLGTNGGAFFNTSAAHPYENPTPLTNFIEMLAILLLPFALCYTFGQLVGDRRQGWAIFCVMLLVFLPILIATILFEFQNGGNMEGKETRIGVLNSALWATAATASSNGSMNAMLDSFTPLGGMMPLLLIHTGEIIYGGLGSGLYGMVALIILAVFIAGLMVGRTPEYLGKKIEPFEMKMATFIILLPLVMVLSLLSVALLTHAKEAIFNPGPHGFTEILYALSSMSGNNGSDFDGLVTNQPFYNIIGGLEMLSTRFLIAIAALSLAGSLGQKKIVPPTSGTLLTHTPLFIGLLLGVLVVMGALSFFPTLLFGPIIEQLSQVVRP